MKCWKPVDSTFAANGAGGGEDLNFKPQPQTQGILKKYHFLEGNDSMGALAEMNLVNCRDGHNEDRCTTQLSPVP